ncbi:MAG: GPR endopeptidase [Eubacteriales bacterium]|nr:GPR endopeptidase [Eubacteriales bacterium]MDD4513479.1 GPR endopeptidase [Eubacteriales bacterium]
MLGQTGLESAEMIAALVKRFSPSCVIAVDALAAQSPERICTTVQIANSGISPGSGVGNHRTGLTEEALGVPVIAIGVPMVVYSSAIARTALTGLLGGEDGEYKREIDELCRQAAQAQAGEMVVTPREVDALVESVSDTLAWGINMALQPDISGEEIALLMQ